MLAAAYVQKRWSLDDLFSSFDAPELNEARQQLETLTAAFETRRTQLSAEISAGSFVEILKGYEEALRLLYRVMYFGHLRFAEDTQDQRSQTYLAQSQQLGAEFDNRTMFFKLWWKGLEDEVAGKLIEAAPDYRYWLEALRLEIPFTLSEAEERVINLKDVNGPSALVTLYDAITNRFAFPFSVDGEQVELTRGELQVYMRDADPELRATAYQTLLQKYETEGPILGQIYQYRLRDWQSEKVGLRGYQSPIAVRNQANDIPDEVVEMLLEVCRTNATIFQRFFKLKARWLGVERIRRYDVYAPVVKSKTRYSFEQGAQLVLDSFAEFEPRVASLAARVLEEDHIDSEVRKGKRSGAFCATVDPELTPWVLVNYQGQPDDVATLAHELGHAIHSLLANDLNALSQGPSLPLAETASTFSEMVLIDHILSNHPPAELERDLLFKQMDDAYATIMRQSFFALFERRAHQLTRDGASVDEISAAYLENLQEQFGEALELSDDFRYEWLAIPHFYHVPFYVYAYAFGQLLVLSLYKQFKEEGESFKPRYLAILAAGGSDSPERILARAGIDIRSRDFWQGGFDVLAEALQRLEELKISAG